MWYNEGNKKLLPSAMVEHPRAVHLVRRCTMSNTIPHFVYELVDPRDDSIFYVGITIDLYQRFRQHMRCDGTNALKDRRISEILTSGHLPIMRTKESVSTSIEASEREVYWIRSYLSQGIALVNITVAIDASQRSKQKVQTEEDVRAWIDNFRIRHPEVDEKQIQFMLRVQLHLLEKTPGWTL